MPQVLFQYKPIDGKDGSVLETLVRLLNQHNMKYDGLQKKGDSVVCVNFLTPEDAKNAYKSLDGKEFMGSHLTIKPGRSADIDQIGDKYGKKRNQQYNSYNGFANIEQYPCRILIPSDMVKVVIGKGGATINEIQTQTNTKIDIHRNKSLIRGEPPEETLTSIKGDPESFSEAIKEIIAVMDKESQKHNYYNNGRRPAQLKLLARDSLCGRIIGKGGENLKKVKNESGVEKLIISNSIYDEGRQFIPNGLYCTGERVVTIEGPIDAICAAEEILSARLRDYMERDMKNSTNDVPPPMDPTYYGSGILTNNPSYPPQPYQQLYGCNGYPSYMGYQGNTHGYPGGSYPGILGNGYPPYASNVYPQSMGNTASNDDEENACIIIPTKEVGAIIGRNGGYINRVKQYSGARVRVVKGDEGGESRVEISGTIEAQWKAFLCIFNKIKETMKLPYSEAQLKTEYMVPGKYIGRIIGKKGQVIQDIQDKSQTEIEVPKEQQGEDDVPIYVTGTFNGTQMAINRIREIIRRAQQKNS